MRVEEKASTNQDNQSQDQDCRYGFGMVYHPIMRFKGISAGAKGLYAYLSGFRGNKNDAWPSTKRILDEMNICRETLYSWRNELVAANVLTFVNHKNRGSNGSRTVYRFKSVEDFIGSCEYEIEDIEDGDTTVDISDSASVENFISVGFFDSASVDNLDHTSVENLDRGVIPESQVSTAVSGSENNNRKEHIYKNNIKKNIYKKKDRENKENSVREKPKSFTPPSLSEVQLYIEEEGLSVDPNEFYDYYTANGWMLGKSTMQDWRATLRNWARRNGRDRHDSSRGGERHVSPEFMEEVRKACECL